MTRERALLGDDAAQFASASDNAATVEDGDDDLLGGGGNYSGGNARSEEITEFESSFPAMDTHNQVGLDIWVPLVHIELRGLLMHSECRSWGHNHRFKPSFPASTASAIIRSIRSVGRRRD